MEAPATPPPTSRRKPYRTLLQTPGTPTKNESPLQCPSQEPPQTPAAVKKESRAPLSPPETPPFDRKPERPLRKPKRPLPKPERPLGKPERPLFETPDGFGRSASPSPEKKVEVEVKEEDVKPDVKPDVAGSDPALDADLKWDLWLYVVAIKRVSLPVPLEDCRLKRRRHSDDGYFPLNPLTITDWSVDDEVRLFLEKELGCGVHRQWGNSSVVMHSKGRSGYVESTFGPLIPHLVKSGFPYKLWIREPFGGKYLHVHRFEYKLPYQNTPARLMQFTVYLHRDQESSFDALFDCHAPTFPEQFKRENRLAPKKTWRWADGIFRETRPEGEDGPLPRGE